MKICCMKWFSLAIALFVFLTLFAGCAANKDAVNKVPAEEKIDMKGYTFNLFGLQEPQKTSPTYAEELDSRKKIEKEYNCKFAYPQWVDSSVEWPKFMTSVLSGKPEFDYYILDAAWAVPGCFVKNLCEPLDEYIDLNDKIWFKDILDLGFYKGKHYLFGGAAGCNANDCIFFNKRIFEKDSLPNLYELQKNKQWTWDKLAEIAQKATKDTNGDGKTDQWGFASGFWFVSAMFDNVISSNGVNILKRENEKDVSMLSDPAAIAALQFAYDLFNVHKVIDPAGVGVADYYDKEFIAGNLAMLNSQWWMAVASFHNAMKNDKYGIVFFPMGPNAKDYTNYINSFSVGIFPAGTKHPKELGKIMTELSKPQPWTASNRTQYEAGVYDDESVNTCLEMDQKLMSSDFLSIPYIRDNLYCSYTSFIKGKQSASAWIESHKAAIQKAIDDVWNVTGNK